MQFSFEARLFVWNEGEPGAWVFVSLPTDITDEIDDGLVAPRRGFGSVRVEVTVGATTWRTSLFPSKAQATYVLPVKRAVLTAEDLEPGDSVEVTVRLVD